MNDEKKVPESFKTYEEGKHRRYTLLFAVNGGAFALAKFIADKATGSVGGLKLSYLCYGMALFTQDAEDLFAGFFWLAGQDCCGAHRLSYLFWLGFGRCKMTRPNQSMKPTPKAFASCAARLKYKL